MKSHVKPTFFIAGSIGTDDIRAHVILDKKNNSIHIHLYGEIFGSTRKPILVKHSDSKFPEGRGAEVAKQIIISEFTNKKIQIKEVRTEKGRAREQTQPGRRTIIRFTKFSR